MTSHLGLLRLQRAEGFAYQVEVAEAFDRICRAYHAVGLDAQRAALLPADARFPELYSPWLR